ncbi:aminotransferase, partial [Corynebacterium bovis]
MTALAARHGAANLGQGFPDDDGPAGMLDRAARAVRDGGAAANQYGPPRGVPALRRAVAE